MTAPADLRREAITIRPVGGLGNQLFSYACGRATAARLGCPLLVDIGALEAQPTSETPRQFDLEWLIDDDAIVAPGSATPAVVRQLRRRLAAVLPSHEFYERSFEYDPRIATVRRGTTLNGYFQSWRYFDSIEAQLRSDLLAKAPTSPWSVEESRLLAELGAWTAVHVRRGDYTEAKNAAFHGVLDRGYYERALEALRAQLPASPLVVFSDEPDAAAALLAPLGDIGRVITSPATAHPMESVSLMAGASGVVTANSSFSWWGAWLADPVRTPSIAPAPWFVGSAASDEDLCPPQWVRVPTSRRT